MIDIIEQEIADMSRELFNVLLKDHTTEKNICWATDYYISKGSSYYPQEPITQDLVTGVNTKTIQPRAAKGIDEQTKRTKEKAEVFTPSWVCNEQNNLIDAAWFGRKNVFNTSDGNSWNTVKGNIEFPEGKSWEKYVDARRLEVSCGEAPYLVSRYDTISGEELPIEKRIGILDRKLRIVNEHTTTEADWYRWVVRAYESTYGYEYQGDNILIARENLLYTFIENMKYRFSHEPDDKQLKQIARIISWNIWQMDGISMTAPFSERPRVNAQMTITDYLEGTQDNDKEPIPCKIFDWRSNNSLEFRTMMKGKNNGEIR
ncbi:MAG: restriction endonuclease subunit M [Eubacteriaceae bacterium]|nr:restriction endonuclease subunit M [Eubacteriaceae bacterium]